MCQIVTFNQAYTMLAGNGAFHFNRPLNHPMDYIFSYLALFLVEEKDSFIILAMRHNRIMVPLTMEVAVANVPNHRCK